MDAQTQAAYEHGVNELGLHDAKIDVVMDAELDIFGKVTKWVYDDDHSLDYYVIVLLPQIVSSLIQTLGHELYHVWEFENDIVACEGVCNAYGDMLVAATGNELHCSQCGKTMTEHEADESEIGSEFVDELVCDDCFNRMKNMEM